MKCPHFDEDCIHLEPCDVIGGEPCQNTDKEIWRKVPGDYYSPSIHVTESGRIGIKVRGRVLIASIEGWYLAGEKMFGDWGRP